MWVDLYGNEHEVESMSLDYVENVISFLRVRARLLWSLVVSDLNLEAIALMLEGCDGADALLDEAARITELGSHEYLECTPLLTALRRRLERCDRDATRDRGTH